MASTKIMYRSKKSEAPLILKLRFNRNKKSFTIDAPINLVVEKGYWEKVHFSKPKDVLITNKQFEINQELLLLEKHISTAISNEDVENLDKSWLVNKIELYYNPKEAVSETVACCIQKIIDDAPYRDNAKGGIGLSKSRVNSYKQLLFHFNKFQGGKKYKIGEVNKKVIDEFRIFLLGKKKFSATYSAKKLSDLKAVCRNAEVNGMSISPEINRIKTKQISPYDDDMNVIPLTIEDINKIEEVKLTREALINARKWLILGVFTGQRGEDLTTRIQKRNFHVYGSGLEIRVTQKKGNKSVRIPVLPKVREIYEQGMPYTVSTQKLRKHFKDIGELAGIDELIMGRVTETVEQDGKKFRRGIKKLRPKYKYIGLHTLRRSFACIHYGKLPTPIIMKITGHKKESTFLQYVNQDGDDHLDVFLDYYKLQGQKDRKESQLSVVSKKDLIQKAN